MDLSNCATKADLNNATGVDTSYFAKKTDLTNLKSDADKLDIDKLVPVTVDLSKLSGVVKNGDVKKDVYSAQMKSIEDKIPELATNTTLNAIISEVKGEMPSITNLATNASLNAKINEVKGEIPSITNLATTADLTTVENKIHNVSDPVKNTDYNTKICETEYKITADHDRCINTQDFNKLTPENFIARLAQANLSSKSDVGNFVKKTDFDDKIKKLSKNVTSNKTKHVLVENELNEKLEKFKSISAKRLTKGFINKFSIFNGAKYFSSGTFQNYLVFIPVKKYIKYFSGTTRINSWNSYGISEENIENVTKSDSNFAPTFVDHFLLSDIDFNKNCLINNNISIAKQVIDIFISYSLNQWQKDLNLDLNTVVNCLFGSVELTKNTNKYK